MEISQGRQDELLEIFQDCLVSWTWWEIVQKRMTFTERNWMFDYIVERLNNAVNLFQRRLPKEIKMAHVGTIVQRKEKETIPEDALSVFTGTYDQYCGYALPEDNEVSVGQLDDPKADIEQTMKDNESPFFVMCAKGADTDESKQPFNTLQNAGGNCICATFIEGDLQGFDAPESSHSIEWNAHQQYLAPKLLDIFNTCGEDLDKVVEKLNSAFTRREILVNCFPTTTARGEILLVFGNGQTVNIVKGDKHQKYPWGEVSQSLGYEGKKAEPVVEKKGGMGKKAATSLPEKPKSTETTVISAAFNKAVNNKANEDFAKQTNLTFMIIPPADRFSSFKDLQGWYRNFGHPDHQPGSEELSATVGKSHAAIPILIHSKFSNAAFNALAGQKKFILAEEQTKGKAPAVVKPEAIIPVSIIPKAELERANKEFWPKVVKAVNNYDDGSHLIVPPDKAAEYTKTRQVATEQMGRQMGLEEFEQLSADAWRMLQKIAPETIISILMQYQYQRYMDHRGLKEAAGLKKAM